MEFYPHLFTFIALLILLVLCLLLDAGRSLLIAASRSPWIASYEKYTFVSPSESP